MSYNFSLHAVQDCLSLLARSELLSDILEKQLYGAISNIWHYPSHIFITADNGRKLFTFDCKPVNSTQGFSSSSLDIQNAPSSIVDVLFISPSLIVIVEGNGHTQWYRFLGFEWVCIGNMELCSSIHSTVSTAAYLPSAKMLVWCERNEKEKHSLEIVESLLSTENKSPSFCIKAKTLQTTDLTSQSLKELEASSNPTLVTKCPECNIFVLASKKLFIRTKAHKDQISVSLVCNADLSEMTLFLGQTSFELAPPSTSNGLDFGALLLSYLPTIIKIESNHGDLGVKVDGQRVVTLSSSGKLEIFSVTGKEKVNHKIVPVSFENSSIQYNHWFLHKNYVGILSHQNLSLFSIDTGVCTCQWTSDGLSSIGTVVQSATPALLGWILMSKGLFALQATDSRALTAYTSADNIPDNDLLQTAVLQLAHTHQLKQQGYDRQVMGKLEMLKNSWAQGKGSHQSQIVEMLAPLVEEYWRLDSKSKALISTQEKSEEEEEEVDKEREDTGRFSDEISKIIMLSRRARESRLLMLSQVYPEELLAHLCQGITIDCEDVIEGELPNWQALLGLEGWDLSRFELTCRLLFQHHPEKLCHFVKCAQSVSEKTVGVSAFVRKKHTLIFYKSAADCLPLAEISCNPKIAAAAQGELIIASGANDSVELALKHLLRHKLWQEAVGLVRLQSTKKHLPCYLYILMVALAQNQCLSEYIKELFALMPTWKSFLTFAQVASSQPEIHKHQLSTSSTDLFCGEDSNVSFGAVRPHLLKLIEKMDQP